MDKKIVGLLGAVGACLTLDATAASATAVQGPAEPRSYADLLRPIPNAKAALDASDADLAKAKGGNVQVAETVIIKRRGFRHHHHHHHFFHRLHERVIIRR